MKMARERSEMMKLLIVTIPYRLNKVSLGQNTHLGLSHELGIGCPKNDQEAFRHYKTAADRDHHAAMIKVARSYSEGKGVEISPAWSTYYYNLAKESEEAA